MVKTVVLSTKQEKTFTFHNANERGAHLSANLLFDGMVTRIMINLPRQWCVDYLADRKQQH